MSSDRSVVPAAAPRAAALADLQVLRGDEIPGDGHDGSPSRLVTDKNQSSSDAWISRRP
jgi:hypothetical protein